MRKAMPMTAVLLLVLSCASMQPGAIRVSEIEGSFHRMIERHDAYTEAALAAGKITEEEAATDLSQSVRLAAILAENDVVMAGDIEADTLAVADRHDAYVLADPDLDDLDRDTYLLTTRAVRKILKTATEDP